jgi:protein TonB
MKFALLLLAAAATATPQELLNAAPSVIRKVEPEYTRQAIEAKVEGSVMLAFVVKIEGTPSEIRVIQGLGKGLDEKAIECLEQWRFRPAARFGSLIAARATVEIKFRMPQAPVQMADSGSIR